jgi:two-component system phosphate regulon response regulator PhoB
MRARTVLMVEGDRFQRRAAEVALRQNGFDVLVASDGEEALALVARGESPDLVLLELIIRKISGFEVLRRLKGNPATAGIPVIVFSNLGAESDMKQAMDGGAAIYLVKANTRLEDLVKRVEETLAEARV